MTFKSKSFDEKFWSKVQKTSTCWVWTGMVNSWGYGNIRLHKKIQSCHRVSYEKHRGEIPPGSFVLHSCDNPACVNPDHLFLGSHIENMNDAKSKGRFAHPIGEKNGSAKLTWFDVRVARRLYSAGLTQKQIAKICGVTKGTIQWIVTDRHWKEASNA